MKLNLLHRVLFILITFGIFSCENTIPTPDSGNNSNNNNAASPYKDVNNWIYDEMKEWYLWSDNMPEKSKTNMTLAPGKDGVYDTQKYYFYSILNDYPNVDRFSWIRENIVDLTNSLTGKSTAFGFTRTAVFLDNSQTNIGFFISYVIKDSPAEKAGLKRGDVILTINGQTINKDNYVTILSNIESATFGLGEQKNGAFVLSGKSLQATKAEIQNDPVHYWTVIEKGNKKIGYLVYSQFIATYDSKLKQVFGEFKSKGINELILDFRMNGGGSVSSADLISSLVVKNPNTNNVIHRDQWNTTITQKYPSVANPTKFSAQANNLGNLDRVFVLTSNNTASASELVINSLRPYMNVVLIGEHTYGKNVASITIKDEENPIRWKWGMQPIVLKTVNAKGESEYGTESGFSPDYIVKDNIYPYLPWGDENETLLKKALEVITGTLATSKGGSNLRSNLNTLDLHVSDLSTMNDKNMYVRMPK